MPCMKQIMVVALQVVLSIINNWDKIDGKGQVSLSSYSSSIATFGIVSLVQVFAYHIGNIDPHLSVREILCK